MINRVIPLDERNTVRRQKSFIVNELLGNKRTNYINTGIFNLSADGDRIRENGHLDKSLFYKNSHLIEKGYLKLALLIKRKINLIQDNFTNKSNIVKRQKSFFNINDFPTLPSKPRTNTNKQDYWRTINILPITIHTQLLVPLKPI